MSEFAKNLIMWIIIAVVLMNVFSYYSQPQENPTEMPYSTFLQQVKNGSVERVVIEESPGVSQITGQTIDGSRFETLGPHDDGLMKDLLDAGVVVEGKEPQGRSIFLEILITLLPVILIVALFMYFMRQMQGGVGGRGGAMSFGKSRAKLQGEDQVKVTFDDVAGCEEAKEEVTEVVDFLRDPSKFQRLGGHIPKGILMVGPPGTGKTLLARAIAGEARVPFFSISGSDFVEMFVGVGASRVRDMFETAKKHAPCIIFIDEIDAVGRHRGAGLGGGHDEREQTLNQLLVEMDGFEGNEGIILIAATNRPDVLDPALLRPGRFDRQVVVGLPDLQGREHILNVHMRKVPVDDDVRPRDLARGTPGFSGADLANLVNEAALFAARQDSRTVKHDHFEQAKDKIMMGAERKSMAMSEKEKLLTAYHEAGHAIVGRLMPDHDPVYKVTIIPRGRALGVTMFLPEQDRYSLTRQQIHSQLASLYGGRVAEELIFGKDAVTTGASNDIERASQLARNMVTKWGLSETMGPLAYGENEDEVFLGRSVTQHKHISDETHRELDAEVRKIIDKAYRTTTEILENNRDKLDLMADALMKYETIDAKQINQIMNGEAPDPPDNWNEGGGRSGSGNKPTEAKGQESGDEDDGEQPSGEPAPG